MKLKPTLNQTFIKVFALIAMTLDHLAIFLGNFCLSPDNWIVYILRAFGRLAMPLFALMIAEGMRYTKSKLKYILRLSIVAIIVSISLIVLNKCTTIMYNTVYAIGNIFLTLALSALTILFLSKKGYMKLLAAFPIGIIITSFVVSNFEYINSAVVYWFPYWMRCQYDIYALALILGFYYCPIIKDKYLRSLEVKSGLEINFYNETTIDTNALNIIEIIMLSTITLLYFVCSLVLGYYIVNAQMCAILSGALLLFYNHQRGYNKKWFQYGAYVYYILHIIILGIIFYLIVK